jgi:2-amino-4-hydroxy-6-hydroxymethyldihydropteridine diphosphokinase
MQNALATKVFILAGSNLGDREAHLAHAVASLAEAGTVAHTSSVYETEPVGYPDQAWFLNQAIEMDTRLTPHGLLCLCQSVEASRGRVRYFANGPRTLDLDILLFGDMVVNDKDLIIPHPRMAERRFVLVPLAQIAADIVHPVFKQSIRSLLEHCPDSAGISLLGQSP